MRQTKNLLFIPCYQCEKQILRVLESLNEAVENFFEEILIIDNRSKDSTVRNAIQAIQSLKVQKKCRVIVNDENINLGGTHKVAFQYSIENNFDHVVILHGDDQARIHDFTDIFKSLKYKVSDSFVMGARFHPSSLLVNYSPFRILGNTVFNLVASLLTHTKVLDLGGSGLNLFPVNLIKEHCFKQYANDLTFHVFLLLNAVSKNQAIEFFPISWREEDQVSNVRLWRQTRKLLEILKDYLLNRYVPGKKEFEINLSYKIMK